MSPPDFPRVSTGAAPLQVEEGDTAVLACTVDSKPRVDTVKWTRGGRYIATTFRHVIPTVSREDEGSYFCQADNGLGQVGKAELVVEVQHGPRVTLPSMEEAGEGAEVVVECKAEAAPAPTSVLWTRADMPEFRQAGRFLTLRNVTHREAGLYTCTVTNTLTPTGEEPRQRVGSGVVRVEVRHAPGAARLLPEQPVGIEGKSVELRCGAEPAGFPAPQYQWWRDGRPAEVLGRGASLILRPVRLASAGSYHCRPYNSLGKGAAGTARLTVVQEPRILTGLQNQVVRREGHAGLNLTCLGMGLPTPTVTWYRGGEEVGEQGRYTVEARDLAGPGGLRVTSTLVFPVLEAADSGEFTCQYDNSVGRAQSAVVVKVEHAPLAANMLTKVAADVGGSAALACRVRAFPAPQFHWERSGVSLTSASLGSRLVTQLSDYEYESVFTVRGVGRASYGQYLCRATNSLGAAEAQVAVVPRGRPDPPGLPRILEVGANRLLLAWEEGFDGGVNDTVWQLRWEEQGGGEESGGEKECREAVCGLKGLQQHTTYRVRLRASNSHGDSPWTDARPFTTQIDVSQVSSHRHDPETTDSPRHVADPPGGDGLL